MWLQKVYNLITHKTFHHLGYMPSNRYWTVIVSVIDVTIIFRNRQYSSIFPVFNTPYSRDIFMTLANDSKLYGADSFNNITSIPRISFLWLLRLRTEIFSISLLDTRVKRKVWMIFYPLLRYHWKVDHVNRANQMKFMFIVMLPSWFHKFTS